jgi:hypothetical protein
MEVLGGFCWSFTWTRLPPSRNIKLGLWRRKRAAGAKEAWRVLGAPLGDHLRCLSWGSLEGFSSSFLAWWSFCLGPLLQGQALWKMWRKDFGHFQEEGTLAWRIREHWEHLRWQVWCLKFSPYFLLLGHSWRLFKIYMMKC